MEQLLNNVLANNDSFAHLINNKNDLKHLKHLAIPNIYSYNCQSTPLKSNKTNCNTEKNCVDDKLIDKLIDLASSSSSSSSSKKKTRKNQNKSNKRLKKSTTKKRRD